MRLAPSLAALLTFLSLAMTSSFAADSATKARPFDQAQALMDSLRAKALPTPKPFGENEQDLFEAMAGGVVPVDPAFCERIKLTEITDGLLPVLKQPIPGPGEPTSQLSGNILTCRLFVLRGLLLCQQGKVAEGQAWLLKPRLMARRPGADQSLIQFLVATAMDAIGQQAAANYVEIWSEADRLAFVKTTESLAKMEGLSSACRRDDGALPANTRIRTLITTFKPLTPAQQQAQIEKLAGPWLGMDDERKVRTRRYLALISSLTVESWDALLDGISAELAPLTTEKLKAFAARNAAAVKLVEAEEAKPSAPAAQKAEALYRVIMGPGIEGIARSRLNLELKDKLLVLAMRKGTAFDATDLANLTTADGKPLTLGKHDGFKAILAPGSDAPFLIIGPVK
ncbi:MAG: hypothetical protein RI910_1422 [Verrucomicrobiota bacterium]